MATMKAMVYRGVGKIVLEDVPRPQIIKPTDAIVRVTSTAICGSDLHILQGDFSVDMGTIIGHEFLGIVEEVGDHVTAFKPGERVLVYPGFRCEICEGSMESCDKYSSSKPSEDIRVCATGRMALQQILLSAPSSASVNIKPTTADFAVP